MPRGVGIERREAFAERLHSVARDDRERRQHTLLGLSPGAKRLDGLRPAVAAETLEFLARRANGGGGFRQRSSEGLDVTRRGGDAPNLFVHFDATGLTPLASFPWTQRWEQNLVHLPFPGTAPAEMWLVVNAVKVRAAATVLEMVPYFRTLVWSSSSR